jgi:hypothetical protein
MNHSLPASVRHGSASILSSSLLFLGILLVSGCEQGTSVKSTVPNDGETGVDPSTKVRVTFESAFNSDADTQDNLTHYSNFTVVGSKGGVYGGTIAVKTEAAAAQDATSSTAITLPTTKSNATDTTTGTPSATSSKTKTSNTNSTTTEAADDTLVFTLASGTTFKLGETVTVKVGGKITVHGTPVRDHSFSFRIRGEDARPGLGDLRVVSTSPQAGEVGVLGRPRMSAIFSQAVKTDAFPDAIVIRGERSGFHKAGESYFAQTLEVVQRLSSKDSFFPGEWVTVTLTDGIQGTTASTTKIDATSLTSLTSSAYPSLPSHGIRFQVKPGLVLNDEWASAESQPVFGDPIRPLGLRAGKMRGTGTEILAFGEDRLEAISTDETWEWQYLSMVRKSDVAEKVVDARLADLDGSGGLEIVVLTTKEAAEDGSALRTVNVGSTGMVEKETPLMVLPAGLARFLGVTDIDGNGFLDLIVTHPNRDYVSQTSATASTGTLTIVEKSREAVDLTTVDLTDPDALKGTPAFHRIENPIPDLPLLRRIEFLDLDASGKAEMIAETETDDGAPGQLLLIQNRGTSSDRFSFLVQRSLLGRDGKGLLAPRAWTAADLDGDGDGDIIAWDDAGALLFRNTILPLADGAKLEAKGLLFENLVPVPLAGLPISTGGPSPLALDLNGDRLIDLVYRGAEGRIVAAMGAAVASGKGPVFETIRTLPVRTAGGLASLVAADADGDTGLDLIAAGDGSGTGLPVEVIRTVSVQSPEAGYSHQFSIDLERSYQDGSDVTIVVKGDIADSFNGYGVVLGFDSTKLDYVGFEETGNLTPYKSMEATSDTKACASGASPCQATASVKVDLKETVSSIKGFLLGAFRFKTKTVSKTELSGIYLRSEGDGSDGKKRTNSIDVVDGQVESEATPKLLEGQFVASLKPAAGAVLEIACSVESAGPNGPFTATVTWNSPGNAAISHLKVFLDDESVDSLLPPLAESVSFPIETGGKHTVKVNAYTTGTAPAGSKECDLAVVFQPGNFTCSKKKVSQTVSRYYLTWSMAHSVDRFQIYRNGSSKGSVAGTVSSWTDEEEPSAFGADLYEIFGVIDQPSTIGAGAVCRTEDPDPATTESPIGLVLTEATRSAAGNPIHLQLSWTNGEAYNDADGIRLRILSRAEDGSSTEVVSQSLSGSTKSFTWNGSGSIGVLPGTYSFALIARAGVKDSVEVSSKSLDVFVPRLGKTFTCSTENGNEVVLAWDRAWPGYGSLEIEVRKDSVLVETIREGLLDLNAYRYVIADPKGDFSFSLIAQPAGTVPARLVPTTGLEKKCTVQFNPALVIGKNETGVGLGDVEIPVQADLFGNVTALRFAVLYPAQFTIAHDAAVPGSGVRIDDQPGASVTVSVTQGADDDLGRPRKRVEVSVENAQFVSGQDQVLLRLVGKVNPDFSLAGTYPLAFDGDPQIRHAGEPAAIAIVGEDSFGELKIHKRYIYLDRESARVGDRSPTTIGFYVTYEDPEPDSHPKGIKITAYSLHFTFDKDLLEIQPLTSEDQAGTAVEDKDSFWLPDSEFVQEAGECTLAWIPLTAAQLQSDDPDGVSPGILQPLFFAKFLPKVPVDPLGAFATIHIVPTTTADTSTLLNVKPALAAEVLIEGWFDGGIDVDPGDHPAIVSIEPATGSLVGGERATVAGYRLLRGTLPSLVFVNRTVNPPKRVPVTDWIDRKDESLVFRVPGSIVESPVLRSTPVDLEVTTSKGGWSISDAYLCERLVLEDSDRESVSEGGGETVVLSGSGFAPADACRVEIVVSGAAASLAGKSLAVKEGGRELSFIVPDLTGHGGKTAEVWVSLIQSGNVVFREKLPSSLSITSTGPKVISVVPDHGAPAGGTVVTIQTSGFPSRLDDGSTVEVLFGSAPATSFTVLGSDSLEATAPAGSAGPARITVRHGGVEAYRDDLFQYSSPRIVSISPAEGPAAGGTQVAIVLADFEGIGSFEVTFGETVASAVTVQGSVLAVVAPAHARGTVTVTVRRGALQATTSFVYRESGIISVQPAKGANPCGVPVTISIEDFGNPPQDPVVLFGGVRAIVRSIAADRLDVLAPPLSSPGSVTVSVSAGGLSDTLEAGFTYEGGTPLSLDAVEPGSGSVCGGEGVTVRGAGFISGLVVRFGAVASSSVVVIDGCSATAVIPAFPGGGMTTVSVSVDGAVFVEKPSAFLYRPDTFIRGDVNESGKVELSDAIVLGDYLTGAIQILPDYDAADANDDGLVNSGDLVAITGHLFRGTGDLPQPFPAAGTDPTADNLPSCEG